MSYPYTPKNNNPFPPVEVGEGRIGVQSPLELARQSGTRQTATAAPQSGFGPKLAQMMEQYPGALQAASDRQQKSYDEMEGLTKGYLGTLGEPNRNDQWGRFGAAMLAPTKTGSFFEGFGNATNAAIDAREQYRSKEQQRQEKLYHANLGLAELSANRPDPTMVGMDNTLKAYEMDNKVGGYIADEELGNGLTPQNPQELLADAQRNPRKYMGARGQALIANAEASVSSAAEHQRQIELERVKAGLKDKPYAPDSGSRKAIRENDQAGVVLGQSLVNLNRAYDLAGTGQSNMGYLAKERAGVAEYLPDWMAPDWAFGSPEQGKNTGELAQIMELEAIKGVGEFLKGPTSDRDVALMLSTLADPKASPERKQAAIDRVKRQVEAQIAFNKEQNTELMTGEAYGMGDGQQGEQRAPEPKDVVGKGADGNDILWEDILFTAEQNGITPDEVIKKLNGE